MKSPGLIIAGSLLVFLAAIATLVWLDRPSQSEGEGAGGDPLIVFCAASNRAVMEAVREQYEQEYGRQVQVQYGASQTLLSSLEVTGIGDLFLPADSSYLDLAQKKGVVAERLPLASMQAVVAVPQGNPRGIQSFADLVQSDVRLVQANPDAAAIGKLTRSTLQKLQLWERLDAATMAYRGTVTDVANDVLVGAADAGIVYDAVLSTFPGLEFVELPEFSETKSAIEVGVIQSTENSAEALHFARYLAARDRGLLKYAELGFRTNDGELWADRPELSVFVGSMLRPAIEDTVVAFEKREGVSVSRVYNGCGILVGQMNAGQQPDAYFACDKEFMNQVSGLFLEPTDVSENELVILVQKGNPHQIASLRDLAKPGLRIGIGHEKQCAMGWITQNTFREGGVQQEVMSNVTVQSATGDMLVNQLLTGSLDAVVAYLTNAAGSADRLDAIRIEGLACSVAIQPWAIAKHSRFPLTTARLFGAICSAESQDIFAAEGFRWQLQPKDPH